MRRQWLAAVLLTCVLLLNGCWSAREINELAFVLSLGVDLTEQGQFEVTAVIGNPITSWTQAAQGSRTPWILSATGPTVFEAVRNLSRVVPRRLHWAHAETIIVSERLAVHGIDEVVDFFTRDHEFRRAIHILVSPAGVEPVVRVPPIFEPSISRALDGLLLNQEANGYVAGVDLNHYLREQTAGQTASPLFVLAAEPEKGLGQSPSERLSLKRSAVLWRNKLVGYLDEAESRGALLLRGELKGGVLSVPCPGHEGRRVTVEVVRSKSQIRSALQGTRLQGSVEVKFTGHIAQVDCPLEITPGSLAELRQLVEQELRDYMETALQKAQGDLGVDPFGFGARLFQTNPRAWFQVSKDWPEAFRKMKVAVDVEVALVGNGLTFNPMKKPR